MLQQWRLPSSASALHLNCRLPHSIEMGPSSARSPLLSCRESTHRSIQTGATSLEVLRRCSSETRLRFPIDRPQGQGAQQTARRLLAVSSRRSIPSLERRLWSLRERYCYGNGSWL